ncbi:MAG: hypothetical protein ABW019_04465 [Chitinophagaceae bacterium]
MRKFGILTSVIFLSVVAAGLYGILHDQLTYSLSPEYFTKFKYRQVGFDPQRFGGHRSAVAVIGFLATWWAGLCTGMVLGLVALIFPDHRSMRRALTTALAIVFITAVLFGIAGFLWGRYWLVVTGVDWWLPPDLLDRNRFIIVGAIHHCSYLGGAAGLLIGIVYLCRRNYLLRMQPKRA